MAAGGRLGPAGAALVGGFAAPWRWEAQGSHGGCAPRGAAAGAECAQEGESPAGRDGEAAAVREGGRRARSLVTRARVEWKTSRLRSVPPDFGAFGQEAPKG